MYKLHYDNFLINEHDDDDDIRWQILQKVLCLLTETHERTKSPSQ